MSDCTVAVDAMGGDSAPEEIVIGAALAAQLYNIKQILVGDKRVIEKILSKLKYPSLLIEVFHASQKIGMDESPKEAMNSKPDASITRAAELVAAKKADALFSAGSTGTVVLASAKHIKRIAGVTRTAIAALFPTMNMSGRNSHLSLIVDAGANVKCSAVELAQFAYMGSAYFKEVCKTEHPLVSLLNIGEEETKGNDILKEAYQILKRLPNLNFTGNIEGKDLLKGITDVILTEGLIGNIVIKTLEGVGKSFGELGKKAAKHKLHWKLGLMLLYKGIKTVKKATDYSEYGGAPLLGFEKMIIIGHGRSNSKAVSNAVKLAALCVKDNVCENIAEGIKGISVNNSAIFK